jgi:hypothetical protein
MQSETKNSKVKQEYILETLKIAGLDKVKDIILKSEKERREHGFRFCKNDKIKVTDTCIGTQCNLTLGYCPEGNITIGSFHTHPTNIKGKVNYLSDEDIYTEASDKSEFACLGLVENNVPKIKCYLPNYGMDKSIIDFRNDYRDKYGTKVREYNPTDKKDIISKLPPQKYNELNRIWKTFLLADKRLKIEAGRAALKLIKEPNEGADLIINL